MAPWYSLDLKLVRQVAGSPDVPRTRHKDEIIREFAYAA